MTRPPHKKLYTRRGSKEWSEDETLRLVEFLDASNLMEYHVVELCGELGRSVQAIDHRIQVLYRGGVLTEEQHRNWPFRGKSVELLVRNAEIPRKAVTGFKDVETRGELRRVFLPPQVGEGVTHHVVIPLHTKTGNGDYAPITESTEPVKVTYVESDEDLATQLKQKVAELNSILHTLAHRNVDVLFNRFDMTEELPICVIRVTKNLFKQQD